MLEQKFLTEEDCNKLYSFLQRMKEFCKVVVKNKNVTLEMKKEFYEFTNNILPEYEEMLKAINKFDSGAVRDILESFVLIFDTYLQFLIKYKDMFIEYNIEERTKDIKNYLDIVNNALSKEL